MQAGGNSHYAFEVLLGRPAERGKGILGDYGVWINSGKAQNKPNMSDLPWSTAEQNRYQLARITDNYDGLVSMRIFNDDTNKVDEWMRWVGRKKNRDTIDKLFSKKRKLGLWGAPSQRKLLGKALPYQSEIRLEHFEELFTTRQLDQTLIPPLMEYLKHYFPGKRGTNSYTDKQLAVYTRIKDALEAGRVVAAGTPDIVGRKSEGQGQSADESMTKGLVGGHAYSVLSVTTVGEHYFVEVRNP